MSLLSVYNKEDSKEQPGFFKKIISWFHSPASKSTAVLLVGFILAFLLYCVLSGVFAAGILSGAGIRQQRIWQGIEHTFPSSRIIHRTFVLSQEVNGRPVERSFSGHCNRLSGKGKGEKAL